MIAYLKERGSAVEDCVTYHGRRSAPAWEELRGRPVEEVAQLVALITLSVGNSLRSLSSEDGRAEPLVEGWPEEELLSLLPLDRDDCDQIWNTYKPIMEHLGLGYAWHRQDDVVRIPSNCRVGGNEQPWDVACHELLKSGVLDSAWTYTFSQYSASRRRPPR
jgi:hypothetical protein